jgi:bifunctional pyridoxal-dependent enzyme with beta-cystathionase and maltose regulon repressor activities
MSEHDRKILRQDLQDEQDELWHTDLSAIGEELSLMPHPLFHPVNPVNPVKNSLL